MTVGFFLSTETINAWLESYGYLVVFLLVMLESVGVPVPGETALIGAALYAGSTHNLEIGWVIAVAIAGAIVGDNIGFSIGRYGGARLLLRYGHRSACTRTGSRSGSAVPPPWRQGRLLGPFRLVLRTWAAFLAGTNKMAWPRFLVFNAAGAIVWASLYGLLYYFFGSVLSELSTAINVALGAVGLLGVVAFIVWTKRKEHDLLERAERELQGTVAEELGEDAPAA